VVQLLRTLDAGEALDVSGLPDPALRARLIQLLSNIQLRRTRQVLRAPLVKLRFHYCVAGYLLS
jgi:hypothetical protein